MTNQWGCKSTTSAPSRATLLHIICESYINQICLSAWRGFGLQGVEEFCSPTCLYIDYSPLNSICHWTRWDNTARTQHKGRTGATQ